MVRLVSFCSSGSLVLCSMVSMVILELTTGVLFIPAGAFSL